MAITTENTFLMIGTTTSGTTTYAKLVDIKDFGDLGSEPTAVDITTLSDHMKKSLPGLKDPGAIPFTANYSSTDYSALLALEGVEKKFAVWFGVNSSGQPDGSNGKMEFDGVLTVYIAGAGVEDPVDMKFSINPTSEIIPAS